MPMDCGLEREVLRLRLQGEIDHHRARELMMKLESQLELDGAEQLELDFGGVTFMDSSGIALVMRLYRTLSLTGGKLRVVNVPQQPGKVLRAAGLHRLFTISYQ